MSQSIRYALIVVILMMIFGGVHKDAISAPLADSDSLEIDVFYCQELTIIACRNAGAAGTYLHYGQYLEGVIAAEWPSPGSGISQTASIEPFKAGIVAARTFSKRNTGGCGARASFMHSNPGLPPYSFTIMYFISQRSDYSQVQSEHEQARQTTDGQVLRRISDNELACAKYFANTGNPTYSCYIDPDSHIQCPGNAPDKSTLRTVPEPVATNRNVSPAWRPGMSQNGSAAWFKGNAPWQRFEQALGHYYHSVAIEGVTNFYRWVWLDVDQSTIVHTGNLTYYEEYWGPTVNMPATVNPNQIIPVTIDIQNTGNGAWLANGSIRLGYHWYQGSTPLSDDGQRGMLPQTLGPGEHTQVTINVHTPSASGNYELRFDMVHEFTTWFTEQSNWPTLNVPVTVITPDTTPPTNPNNLGPGGSHTPNNWSNDDTIYAEWIGASDNKTPVNELVYSIDWTASASTLPDTSVDTSTASSNSPTLADGSWYLHTRTRDNAGNWAGNAAHFGPFKIDTTPPSGLHIARKRYASKRKELEPRSG